MFYYDKHNSDAFYIKATCVSFFILPLLLLCNENHLFSEMLSLQILHQTPNIMSTYHSFFLMPVTTVILIDIFPLVVLQPKNIQHIFVPFHFGTNMQQS